jgi:hypothetical protein
LFSFIFWRQDLVNFALAGLKPMILLPPTPE